MILLDTNYIIRFLTNDDKILAQDAKNIIREEGEIYISSLSIAETAYFLRTQYKLDKDSICNQILSFLRFSNIISSNFVQKAIQIYSIENISFYDCMILSEALSKNATLKTFDKKLQKIYLKYLKN